MPKTSQTGSISRTLVLPRKHQFDQGTVGTFRLRYLLAEDGCKESQVSLAKALLNAPSYNQQERKDNAQLAVHWLLKAAKTGHEEAFLLLKNCVLSNVGINAINLPEVEKCLKLTANEKISRRVASALFCAIMSDTEDLIDSDIFREKVDLFKDENQEKVSTNTTEDPPTLVATETSLRQQAHVSFIEVVNSVQSCLEGNVPLVSLKRVTDYNQYSKFLSGKCIRALRESILQSAENFCEKFASLVIPLAALFLCIMLQIAEFLSTSNGTILFMRKATLFSILFTCFIAMISFSCFIIHINFGDGNIKQWLHLIKFFEPNIRPSIIERKYLSKTTFAYTSFYFVSFVYVFLVPLTPVPIALIDVGILSFIFMLLTDRTICHQRYYVNISLTLNCLICLYKSNALQNLDLISLPFSFSGINYEIFENVYLHLGFISCLALPFVLPYLYIKMIWSQKNGWHLVLFPHLMSLIWMNLAFHNLSGSTATNQFLGVCCCLAILFLSKYIGLFFTLIFSFFTKVALTVEMFQLEILFVLLVFIVMFMLSSLIVRKCRLSSELGLCCFIMCLIILILSYQTVKPQESSGDSLVSEVLPWEKYQSHCYHNAWYRGNAAEIQISCLPLKGRKISMEGTVTDIDVIKVHNNMEFITSFLPQPLRDIFACGFGINYAECKSEIENINKAHCQLYESLSFKQCHLQNWNSYQYRLVLEISSRTSPEVEIFADNFCSDFVRNLKEGDSLQLIGILKSNIGSSSPAFVLQQAKCSTCPTNILYETTILPLLDYRLSVKNVLGLYLAPLLKYEPQ